MSHHKHILAVSTAAALLLTLRASADEAAPGVPAPSTNKPAFKASLRAGETIGMHQMQRAFLNIGTNQIAFIVPTGFQMDATNPQKIVLTEPAHGYYITVRVSNAAEVGSDSSAFKADALSRFPGAKITQESADFAANHSGSAFNLEWMNPNGVAQSARISFIPSAAGILEFSVVARSADFKDARNYFDILLGSVQNNESGKLVIVPLPDFS
jgi:hypothetical protein